MSSPKKLLQRYINEVDAPDEPVNKRLKLLSESVLSAYTACGMLFPTVISGKLKFFALFSGIGKIFFDQVMNDHERDGIQPPFDLSRRTMKELLDENDRRIEKIVNFLNVSEGKMVLIQAVREEFFECYLSRAVDVTETEFQLYVGRLSEGMDLDQKVVETVGNYLYPERQEEKNEQLTLREKINSILNSRWQPVFKVGATVGRHNKVWTMEEYPQYIFKKQSRSSSKRTVTAKKRYQMMVFARKICDLFEFDHLVLPHAALIQIPSKTGTRKVTVIVEEKLNVSRSKFYLKDVWFHHAQNLELAAKQLCMFQTITQLRGINHRNFPAVSERVEGKTLYRKIALVDVEEIGRGGDFNGTTPLMMVEKSAKRVSASLRSEGYHHCNLFFEEIKKRENRYRKLMGFYEEKGVKVGNEPIIFDPSYVDVEGIADNIDALGEVGYERVRKCMRKIIDDINRCVAENFDPDLPVAVNRIIAIDASDTPWSIWAELVKEDIDQYGSVEEVPNGIYERAARRSYNYYGCNPQKRYRKDDKSYFEAAFKKLIQSNVIFRINAIRREAIWVFQV